MTRPARTPHRRRSIATRTWTAVTLSNGMTGGETDENGRTGSRTCPECGFRLDDVDGRGTHPWCAATPAAGTP